MGAALGFRNQPQEATFAQHLLSTSHPHTRTLTHTHALMHMHMCSLRDEATSCTHSPDEQKPEVLQLWPRRKLGWNR